MMNMTFRSEFLRILASSAASAPSLQQACSIQRRIFRELTTGVRCWSKTTKPTDNTRLVRNINKAAELSLAKHCHVARCLKNCTPMLCKVHNSTLFLPNRKSSFWTKRSNPFSLSLYQNSLYCPNFINSACMQSACGNFMSGRRFVSQRSSPRPFDEPSQDEVMATLTRQRIAEAGMLDEAVRKAPNIFSDNAGWIIRLAIDNGYSSFCRNAYLSTMVAMAVQMQEHLVPYSKEVSFLFLLMGAGQLVYGTMAYTYAVLKLRRRTFTSRCTALTACFFALLHLFLWSGAILIFIGYADDDEVVVVVEETPTDGNEEEDSIEKV